MQNEKNTNIAIIGGGASGLVAAISALRNNAKVIIYEKNTKLAKKVLASGNGRCNVTNEDLSLEHFYGKDKDFIKKVLDTFSLQECKNFFESIGVKLFKKENGRYYPLSNQASSISNALEEEFKNLGGLIKLNSKVETINKAKNGFEVFANNKKKVFDRVLVSTGGKAMEKLGGNENGYKFAKHFGHKISPLFASLVQIVCKEDTNNVNGVKIKGELEVKVDGILCKKALGDILFTNYGLSGSAILDVSRFVAEALLCKKQSNIIIDTLPKITVDELKNTLYNFIKIQSQREILSLLNGLINKKLALHILSRSKICGYKKANKISKKEINTIIYTLKHLNFYPKETKGFDFAEVSAGGVQTKDINPKNMASKLTQGLYFSGEVLDVDGDCGGFNLHWAWASGYLAGKAMSLDLV